MTISLVFIGFEQHGNLHWFSGEVLPCGVWQLGAKKYKGGRARNDKALFVALNLC